MLNPYNKKTRVFISEELATEYYKHDIKDIKINWKSEQQEMIPLWSRIAEIMTPEMQLWVNNRYKDLSANSYK